MTCPLCDGTGYKDHAGFAMDPCDHKEHNMTLKVGDKVQKTKGYKWPGVVVGVFDTLAGKTRIVVECTVPEVAGALHIYNLEQVELIA